MSLVLKQLCFCWCGGFAIGKNRVAEVLLSQNNLFFPPLSLTHHRFLAGGEALQRASGIPMSLLDVWAQFWVCDCNSGIWVFVISIQGAGHDAAGWALPALLINH